MEERLTELVVRAMEDWPPFSPLPRHRTLLTPEVEGLWQGRSADLLFLAGLHRLRGAGTNLYLFLSDLTTLEGWFYFYFFW